MGNSPERDAERQWLETTLLAVIKAGVERYDYWYLHERAISQKLPKEATAGVTQDSLLRMFCGEHRDPRCRVEKAPERFTGRKTKVRKIMVLAALQRLERGCRIEQVTGAVITREKCRPRKFKPSLAYRTIGIMDALARASIDESDRVELGLGEPEVLPARPG